ncbi:MAG: hypothetical protein ACU83O_07985 [Gammaproteobacteria bacterium]
MFKRKPLVERKVEQKSGVKIGVEPSIRLCSMQTLRCENQE